MLNTIKQQINMFTNMTTQGNMDIDKLKEAAYVLNCEINKFLLSKPQTKHDNAWISRRVPGIKPRTNNTLNHTQ